MLALNPIRETAMLSIESTNVTAAMNIFGLVGNGAPEIDSVVSPEILAFVFGDKPLPFQTNPDGSVDMAVYMSWLEDAWKMALEAFDEHFDSIEHVSKAD